MKRAEKRDYKKLAQTMGRVDFGGMSEKELAKVLHYIGENANSGARALWLKRSKNSYNFSMGDQLSQRELNDLESAGIPTFIHDKIGPSLERLKYLITANSPAFRATSISGTRVVEADLATKMLMRSLEKSNFQSLAGLYIENSLSKSLGYLYVYPDQNADDGSGEVMFNTLPTWDVVVAENSKDIMFQDAHYIQVEQHLTKQALCEQLPMFKREILGARGNPFQSDSGTHRVEEISENIYASDIHEILNKTGDPAARITLHTQFSKESKPYRRMVVQNVPEDVDLKQAEQGVQEYMKMIEQEVNLEFAERVARINEMKEDEAISEERHQIELKKLEKEKGETMRAHLEESRKRAAEDLYAIEVVVMKEAEADEFKKQATDLGYQIIRDVKFWKPHVIRIRSVGFDTFLDRVDLGITHYPIIPLPYHYTGTPYPTSLVSKVIGKQEEVNKSHQLLLYHVTLGAAIRWLHESGSITDPKKWDENCTVPNARLEYNRGWNAPVPVLPAQIPNMLADVVKEGEMGIEDSMGATTLPSVAGDLSRMPFKGMIQMDEVNTRRIRAWIKNVMEPALKMAGTVFVEMARQVYTEYKVMSYLDPNTAEYKVLEINRPQYKLDGNAYAPGHTVFDDVADITIIPGSTLPRSTELNYMKLKELRELGVAVDDADLLASADVGDRATMIEKANTIRQQEQMIQQLQSTVDQHQITIKSLTHKLTTAGIRVDVASAQSAISQRIHEAESRISATEAKTRADLKAATLIAINKAKADAEKGKKEGDKKRNT